MDWEAIRQWARQYWADTDSTWSSAECREYYARQYLEEVTKRQLREMPKPPIEAAAKARQRD